MDIEILYTEGSAGAKALQTATERILEELAPQEHVRLGRIGGADMAKHGRFSGSPTLKINGVPVEPAEPLDPAQAAEVDHASVHGQAPVPSDEQIRAAVLAATRTSAVRMPLRYRRMIMIAALAILAGVVLGQFIASGTVLTLAGIGLLAVALANNGRRAGPQPAMWVAGFSALAWLVATVWYFNPVMVPGLRLPGGFAPLVFWSGVAAFTITALTVVTAAVIRARFRRHLSGSDQH